MLEGSLYKNIFIFSLPLMFSNMLQVLFNMSDIAVAGHFAGPAASRRPEILADSRSASGDPPSSPHFASQGRFSWRISAPDE